MATRRCLRLRECRQCMHACRVDLTQLIRAAAVAAPRKTHDGDALICKLPYLKNNGAIVFEKPLSTDKGFAICIEPLSGKSTGSSRDKRVN